MRTTLTTILVTVLLSGCASEFTGHYRALNGSWSLTEESPATFSVRIAEEGDDGLGVTITSGQRSVSAVQPE